MRLQRNVSLKNHTTFRIGGRAKYFFVAKTKLSLVKAIKWARERNLPFFVLGGGSNLLVSDKGFNGLVIKIGNCKLKIENSEVITGAGVSLAKLVSVTTNAGLSGLEWAAGIPGAVVGGATRGNAGAFGTEMKDLVEGVEALDVKSGEIRILKNKDCKFSYRDSIFKKNPDLIILSCELRLKKGNKTIIKQKIREYLDYRQEKHPPEPSAGSIFKKVGSVPAAILIHRAGLTGKKIGGAAISKKHSNFIINSGGAKAKDVLKLINLIKKEIQNKFGIQLEEEIQYLGF